MSSHNDVNLTTAQYQFVHAKSHVLALACPGSGKTSSLACRVAHLLASNPACRVAAVTFSNPAAAELGDRVRRKVHRSAHSRFICGTFHGLSYGQLKASASTRLKIVNEREQRSLLRRARDNIGLPLDDDTALAWVETAKRSADGNMNPDQFRLLESYQQMLHHLGAVDFADLLKLAVEGMASRAVAPLPVAHLLIDEFQDADELQHQWIDQHVELGAIASAVADDDQSIYGWRNARGYHGLEDFRLRYCAETIVLGENFRSRSEIVSLAGLVVERNTERIEKRVRSARGPGGAVQIREMPSIGVEAECIRSAALEDQGGWTVIGRTNSMLDRVQLELEAHEIPFTRLGGESFWDSEGPSALVSLLDSVAGESALGAEHALAFVKSDRAILQSLHLQSLLREGRRAVQTGDKMVDQFARLLTEWRASARADHAGNEIVECGSWLARNVPRKSLRPSIEAASTALQKRSGPLAHRLSLLSRGAKPANDDPLGVVLCTMHASKGLEFDRVWLMGLQRGGCPHDHATDVEEERRLLYVALTRARERLVISGAVAPHGTSPFFSELQTDLRRSTYR